MQPVSIANKHIYRSIDCREQLVNKHSFCNIFARPNYTIQTLYYEWRRLPSQKSSEGYKLAETNVDILSQKGIKTHTSLRRRYRAPQLIQDHKNTEQTGRSEKESANN